VAFDRAIQKVVWQRVGPEFKSAVEAN
jgi:hypothetical protein